LIIKKTKIFILFFIIIFFCAFNIPNKPDNYVNDYTGTLKYYELDALNKYCADFELQTSTQIFTAIFESLEGNAIEEISLKVVEKWQIGQKGRDNGILLIIFLKDRKMRIEVGYGLEGALPDGLAFNIISKVIKPEFQNGKFYDGIYNGIAEIKKAVANE